MTKTKKTTKSRARTRPTRRATPRVRTAKPKPAPRIDVLSTLKAKPGDTVVIQGQFMDPATAVAKFSPDQAAQRTAITANGTKLTVQVPPNAQTGPMYVETANGKSATFQFTVENAPVTPSRPVLYSADRYKGKPGESLTIVGANLTPDVFVTFNGVFAPRVVLTGDRLSVTIPNNATTGDMKLVNAQGESNGLNFEVETTQPAPVKPTIASYPPTGKIGAEYAFVARDFGTHPMVKMPNGVLVPTVVSGNDVKFTVPPHTPTGNTTLVLVSDANVASDSFNVTLESATARKINWALIIPLVAGNVLALFVLALPVDYWIRALLVTILMGIDVVFGLNRWWIAKNNPWSAFYLASDLVDIIAIVLAYGTLNEQAGIVSYILAIITAGALEGFGLYQIEK